MEGWDGEMECKEAVRERISEENLNKCILGIFSSAISFPFVRSHSFSFLSFPTESATRPLGWRASPRTPPLCGGEGGRDKLWGKKNFLFRVKEISEYIMLKMCLKRLREAKSGKGKESILYC